jgi:hypothetical protein
MHLHHYCLAAMIAAALIPASPAIAAQQGTAKPATPQEKPQPPAKVNPEDLPVSLDRIQKALANTPKLTFDEQQRPVYRTQVFGEKPSIDDILGPDWATGPVKYGSITHQEFLAMVTPRDLQGYGALTNSEGATIAATSLALQWSLQRAVRKFRETTDEREKEAARKEVLEALNALEQARAKAAGK